MRIELVNGNIADQKVDVLVNSTTKNLDLSSGPVTKAILKAGGDNLQKQCRDTCPDGVEYGEICSTEGGNLKCEEVYHSALPHWGNYARQVLSDFINSCLTEADNCNYTSIAFPALGTGNLKYPPETVAEVFFEAVKDFVNNASCRSLRIVRIVIFPTDHPVIKAFSDVKKNYETQIQISSRLNTTQPQQQGNPYPTQQGAKVGDIAKETTDVIVNTTNPGLVLSDGIVSKIILAAAGDELQKECKQTYPSGIKSGEVAVTKGGNLQCNAVYHITLTDSWATNQQQTEKDVKSVMLKCLKLADGAGCSSLSMPALGTGKLKYNPSRIAEIMYEVAISFRSQNLNKVRFVVHSSTPNVIQAFEAERTRRRQALAAKISPSLSFAKTLGQVSSIKISMVRGCIEDQEVDVLVNSTTADLNLRSGPLTRAILNTAGSEIQDECKRKYPNGIKNGEVAVTSGGDLSKQGVKQIYHTTMVKWEDNNPRVEKAFRDLIYNCLKTACQNLHGRVAIPILGTGVLKYPPECAARWVVESIRHFGTRNPACTLTEIRIVIHPNDNKNIQALQDLNMSGMGSMGEGEQIFLPVEWTTMTKNTYYQIVPIKPGCHEYHTVQSQFAKSMGAHTIVSIDRIQNRELYCQYIMKKKRMDTLRPGSQNERQLWHGTSELATMSINLKGFNRSFCGKNATMYGEGVYFALNSSYSAQDQYSGRDSNGLKRLYLAEVLTGEFTKGSKGLRDPPPKNPTVPQETYDSLVDNVHNPEIFVIFHDTQAYPSYLITFSV